MKRPSKNVIWMIVLIVMFLIAIATRWEYIRAEAGAAFGRLFE